VRRLQLATLGVVALATAGVLTGCGSSSKPAKPAYCADVTAFNNSVEQLKNVTNASGLVTQVQKVASTGQTAFTAVKSGFAPETSAVKSSLTKLENSAQQLSSSSTRVSALAAMPGEVQAVTTAAENLANAAKSSCK
jgi:hypothetical protein